MDSKFLSIKIPFSLWFITNLAFSPLQAEANPEHRYEVHDYVTIGGGTAGLTLAYLLSRDELDVVVLEAGPNRDKDPDILIPKAIGALETQWRNEYFWTADGKPQAGLPNDEAHFSGGRILGGSSSINDSIYWRGMQRTYDQWGGLFADAGYVRNAFKASESFHGITEVANARGKNGPFHVTQSFSTPIGEKWVAAMQHVLKRDYNVDVPIVADLHTVNGPALSPFAQLYIDPETNTRVSTSNALLNKPPKTMDIRLQATATRIIFKHGKARKVRYIQNGISKEIHARKRIILSAGIHSAKLLQLSGIGDADDLRAAGVEVVHDNSKVGKNLSNHLLLTLVANVTPEDNQQISSSLAFKQLGGMGAIADPDSINQMDRHLEFGTVNPAPGISAFAVILTAPESKGYQKITSNDPLAAPVVDFNYMIEAVDRKRMVTGLTILKKTIEKIAETDPAYSIRSNISNPVEYVKNNTVHIHHFSGTNAIGSVVDKHLNVMGVENLMVADVSVSPVMVRGHTHAAAILIGMVAYSEITGNKTVIFD